MSGPEEVPLVAHALGAPAPALRPAPARRDWMDASPEGFANRCLPLTIANAHGWEILTGADSEAWWRGGAALGDVVVRTLSPGPTAPVSHFGAGVLTFHVEALFTTPPGWSLWVSGPPNAPRDGIAPLTGVVETDWSPATFTLNWRFTRPRHPVRFRAGEPVGFVFPLPRDLIGRVRPSIRRLSEDPALETAHRAWGEARGAFNAALRRPGSPERVAGWQRDYHRGRIAGAEPAADHLTRARPLPFETG